MRWCHESWLWSPPTHEASHRNMVIILTALSPIILITGEAGDQSEARVRDSWPIRGQLTEVAGWYQAESDLANNSRTQTSLAKTAIMKLRLVQSQVEVSSSSGSALNCWAWSCLNEMRELSDLDQHQCTRDHFISGQGWGQWGAERLVFGAIFWLIMFDHAKSRVMIPAKPGLIDTIATAPLRAQSVSD